MIAEKKIGILDIGLSTVMMLIAYYDKTGTIKIINEFGGTTRLGFGINKTGMLSNNNIKKTIDTCNEVIGLAQRDGVEKIIVVTTSSLKNAKNKTEFLVGCQKSFNIFPNVLTENEEVKLIYKGAIPNHIELDSPIILIEVGGYNTYVAFGSKAMLIKPYVLNLGMYDIIESPVTKRFFFGFHSHAKTYIKEKFSVEKNEILHWLEKRKPLVICTGINTSIYAGLLLGRSIQNRIDVESRLCSTQDLECLYNKLARDPSSIRAKVQDIAPERVNVAIPWMEILLHLLKIIRVDEFRLSANGLRLGVLKKYLESPSFV